MPPSKSPAGAAYRSGQADDPAPGPWPRCSAAAAFFEEQLGDFLRRCPQARSLSDRFLDEAGVRLGSIVDDWTIPAGPEQIDRLKSLGLIPVQTSDGDDVWVHPNARLPRVRLDATITTPRFALMVEDLDQFFEKNSIVFEQRMGDKDSRYEEAICQAEGGTFSITSRRGYDGFRWESLSASGARSLRQARSAFRQRTRSDDENAVVAECQTLCQYAAAELGEGRAVDEFFYAERSYYLDRNQAAAWQYSRQQDLGLGWANHDHHTYRSSRTSFAGLIGLWRSLGFVARERFYAGAEAGWGAQIMEHPASRVVLFNDVDMAPDELDVDFGATELPPRPSLGTIGLWCALHGSSVAQAGMHHLEAEFDFFRIRQHLELAGFGVMPPFTDLPVLKQAFTSAETWPVDAERLQDLYARSSITQEQASHLLASGAPGSHLEILQRWDGFKGFNRTGISAIIRETDARRAAEESGLFPQREDGKASVQ